MGTKVLSDRAILGMYYPVLEQADKSFINDIANRFPSDQENERYVWLGNAPFFREWVGGRQSKTFRDFQYNIENKDFESTIEFHERDLAEDKTGQLEVRIREHAEQGLDLHEDLIITALLNGASTVCYDGQYFFDTDHSEGDSGSQSNSISVDISALPTAAHGSTTDPSVEEMSLAIQAGIKQQYSYKDDNGRPLNRRAREFTVMTGVGLSDKVRAAVNNAVIGLGITNTLANDGEIKIKVVVNPLITWTDKFAIIRTDGNVKPFIIQDREPLTVDVLGEGSDYYFETRRKKAGLKAAGNVGYGRWQGATLVTLT